MIECVIKEINAQLCDLTAGGKLYGLASTMYRTGGERTQQIPAEVSADGEGKYIGLDDTWPLQLYHRLNSMSASLLTASGYGDGAGDYLNVFNLSMVVYFSRKKMKMLPDDFMLLVQNRIAFTFSMEPFKQIRVRMIGANMNEQAVFNQEYVNTDFRISPDSSLMQINYTVDAVFKQGCITQCICK